MVSMVKSEAMIQAILRSMHLPTPPNRVALNLRKVDLDLNPETFTKLGRHTSKIQEADMPARKNDQASKIDGRKTSKRTTALEKASFPLPESMVTGKASSAKAAVGDKPVFAYIAGLPQPQRSIAERVDAIAAESLPGLQRSVKWGMSYYGVGDGWCFCCGGFAGHVKLMFMNGASLTPVPPVTPVAMGKSTRGVELKSVDELDEKQITAWMKQVTALPGVGGKKR